MEQLLKDFGNLLGMQNLQALPDKLLRLHMENVGDLDFFYEEEREYLLMRLTKSIPFLGKELLLNLLAATHYRHISPQPIRPWFEKPDRIGFGVIFSHREATPDRLYQKLELLTQELEKIRS